MLTFPHTHTYTQQESLMGNSMTGLRSSSATQAGPKGATGDKGEAGRPGDRGEKVSQSSIPAFVQHVNIYVCECVCECV